MTENNSQPRRAAVRGNQSATSHTNSATTTTQSMIPLQNSSDSDLSAPERQQLIEDIRRIISRPRRSPKRKLFEDDEEEEAVSDKSQSSTSGESSCDESLSRSSKARKFDTSFDNWFESQNQIFRQQWVEKYNFDITQGEPLQGNYSWEKISNQDNATEHR